MEVLKSMNGLKTLPTDFLTANECRRNFRLGKKLFWAFLVAESLDANQIRDFHIFLTLIESLEKSLRVGFSSRDDLLSITFLGLVRIENLLENYESPVTDLFRQDLTNLKFTLEHQLRENI